MILAPLQKLTNNVGDLGKTIVATGFEWLPKVQKIAQSGHSATCYSDSHTFVRYLCQCMSIETLVFLNCLISMVNRHTINLTEAANQKTNYF